MAQSMCEMGLIARIELKKRKQETKRQALSFQWQETTGSTQPAQRPYIAIFQTCFP